MKLKSIIPLLLSLVAFALASCDETKEVDAYANWQERNEAFINSVKTEALANADGNWAVIKDYQYTADGEGVSFNGNVNQYIYVRKLHNGNGVQPMLTDSIYLSYAGQLMPFDSDNDGKVDTTFFDRSFYGNPVTMFENTFDTKAVSTITPVKKSVNSFISGFTTALLHMKVGDVWKVYLPAKLAYGSSEQGTIPANSVLVFYIYLHAAYPIGTVVPQWK